MIFIFIFLHHPIILLKKNIKISLMLLVIIIPSVSMFDLKLVKEKLMFIFTIRVGKY